MRQIIKKLREDTDKNFYVVILVFTLLGISLIAISSAITHSAEGRQEVFSEFLKELGIVILAVFSISLLYELFVAHKHTERFLASLRDQIEKGESNSATCALLGILEIFPHRDRYREHYPLDDLVSSLGSGSAIRVVGQSLNLLMANPKIIKDAIKAGTQVELCFLNPKSVAIGKHPDLQIEHIALSIAVLRKEIAEWLKSELPQGQLEIKCHQVLIVDSYLYLKSSSRDFMIWDWGFGRDADFHRIIKLDSQKPLGHNIQERYSYIWNNAETVFQYKEKKTITDELTAVMTNVNNQSLSMVKADPS